MAQQDIINNPWGSTTNSETFSYQNGETVSYTYSATGSDPGYVGTPGGLLENSAIIGPDGSNSVTLDFDKPTTNLTLAFRFFDGTENIQVSIDGNVVDFNSLIASGDVTYGYDPHGGMLQHPFAVSTLVNGSGNLQYLGTNTDVVSVTFNYPVQEVFVTHLHSTAGQDVVMDAYLDDDAQYAPPSNPCFTAGTLIDTDQGPVAVETLQAGDLIRTKDHGFQPVKWVGGSRVMDAPVRIKAGTFGNARDLVVSPRHRMLVQGWQVDLMFNHEEIFATAGAMKNGTTITQEPEGWVEYFHVLLDRHEVIYAEGAETESFFPDEASLNGMAKNTREELAAAVDLSTYGRTARPTLTANQAMYLSHNMDLLEDPPNQIAAQ